MHGLKKTALQILYPLERIFKIDLKYLASGGFWTGVSFFVGLVGSIVSMVAFGNLLPRETYGTYSYLLSLGASLSFLTLSGTGTAVMRAVARGYENVVPYALKMQLKWNTLACLTILAVATYYGYKGNFLFATSLALLVLAYPIAETFHVYKSILTGKKRFDTLMKMTTVTTLIGTIATVWILLLTDNILSLIILYMVMSIIPNIIAYKLSIRDIDQSQPDENQIMEMRRTSLHQTGAGIIGIIASYIDKVVLFQVAGPAVLAVYTFAIAGPDRLKSLAKNLMSVGFPSLTSRSLDQIEKVVYWRILLSLIVGVGFFVIYWFLSPVLFKLFLPKYLDAVSYSRVLSLGIIFIPVSTYFGGIFAGQNMLRATYVLNLINHTIRIILFLIFGWMWQIWGLIVASIASQFINAFAGLVIWWVESKRLIRINEIK